MAFKNSVKATLLFDLEQPRARSDEADAIFDAPAPDPVAPPVEVTIVPPRASRKALIAAAWHKRAEELCVLADTLPSKDSWSLISKIASLYDELARDAGWGKEAEEEAAAPAPVEARLEDSQPEDEPPPEPRAPERLAFRRRPLPGRPTPRRRA